MPAHTDPLSLLDERFGAGREVATLSVPGRVNLIGEHVDYHNLPVLPMAIQRRVRIAFRPRPDRRIRAVSAGEFGGREFEWTPALEPGASGDWVNYVRAAAQAVSDRWGVRNGVDVALVSDLPPAAGLSSSSAVLVGITLALLRANSIAAGFDELMEVLPEGEHFVGTRGGGMDHAAVLASKAGCALLVHFAPVRVEHVPVPEDWAFLVAHSLTTAEKSGEVRAEYNSRRTASTAGLQKLGFPSFAEAVAQQTLVELTELANERLEGAERLCFLHVAGEAFRVQEALSAMRAGDADAFGALLDASHSSLRDQLQVSCPALDALVEAARRAGALGARLTGAGFGGCAVILCRAAERDTVARRLLERHYSRLSGFDPAKHLIAAEPSAGALCA